MKALIPALFLAFTSTAQAQTLCQAEGDAFPLRQVSIQWGERIPGSDSSPFFRSWEQKVTISLYGPRYYETFRAVASHSSHNTRLGEEHFISMKLGNKGSISLRKLLFPSEGRGFRSSYLYLNEVQPDQKQIQLDCQEGE